MHKISLHGLLERRQLSLIKWLLHDLSNKYNLLSLQLEELEDEGLEQELLKDIEEKRHKFSQFLEFKKRLFSPKATATHSDIFLITKELFSRELQEKNIIQFHQLKEENKESNALENINMCWLYIYLCLHSSFLDNEPFEESIEFLEGKDEVKKFYLETFKPWFQSFFVS